MLMKTKPLVDSNIFVYAYDANSVFHADAVAFLSDPNFDFHTSTKNISEYFAVLSKQNAPFDKVFRFYQDILQNCKLVFPTKASLAIFENLLHKYQPRGNRVFDLEIVPVALAHGIPEICTVNVKDFSEMTEIAVLPI